MDRPRIQPSGEPSSPSGVRGAWVRGQRPRVRDGKGRGSFKDRGRRVTEMVNAMRQMWSDDEVDFDGEF
ncbi:hypothetical protein ABZ341_41830, partial [Streptomyces sp. NPDC006173]